MFFLFRKAPRHSNIQMKQFVWPRKVTACCLLLAHSHIFHFMMLDVVRLWDISTQVIRAQVSACLFKGARKLPSVLQTYNEIIKNYCHRHLIIIIIISAKEIHVHCCRGPKRDLFIFLLVMKT